MITITKKIHIVFLKIWEDILYIFHLVFTLVTTFFFEVVEFLKKLFGAKSFVFAKKVIKFKGFELKPIYLKVESFDSQAPPKYRI
jgi:hypothetical protein